MVAVIVIKIWRSFPFMMLSLLAALAALAGFAMSRFHARILGPYNQALLIVQMFPLILAIIPLFIFFRSLNTTVRL